MNTYFERTRGAYVALKDAAVRVTIARVLESSKSGKDSKLRIDGTLTDKHGTVRKVLRAGTINIHSATIDCVVKVPQESDWWEQEENRFDLETLEIETGGFEALFEQGENVPYFCLVVRYGTRPILLTEDLTMNGQRNVRSTQDNQRNHKIIQEDPITGSSRTIWSDLKLISGEQQKDYLARGKRYVHPENVSSIN